MLVAYMGAVTKTRPSYNERFSSFERAMMLWSRSPPQPNPSLHSSETNSAASPGRSESTAGGGTVRRRARSSQAWRYRWKNIGEEYGPHSTTGCDSAHQPM